MHNIQDLKTKIGKMLIFGIGPVALATDSEDKVFNALDKLKLQGINNLILYRENIGAPQDLTKIINYFKSSLEPYSLGGLNIDPMIMIDQEGGRVLRLKKENGFAGYQDGDYPSAKQIADSYMFSNNPEKDFADMFSYSSLQVGLPVINQEKLEIDSQSAKSAFEIYKEMGGELAEYKIDVALGPDIDLDLGNKVISGFNRSYDRDPYKVAAYSAAYIGGMREQGIKTVCKHFPGHGSIGNGGEQDSHKGYVDLTSTFQIEELIPYKILIDSSATQDLFAIMTAHIVNKNLDDSGLPATLSSKILGGLKNGEIFNNILPSDIEVNLHNTLQDNLTKFAGPVISDDMMMLAIQKEYELKDAVIKAINAGCDMLMFSNHKYCTTDKWKTVEPCEVIDIITHAVQDGLISNERIEDAIHRISTWNGQEV